MTIIEMVAIVATISQAAKEFLRKWIDIKGPLTIVLVSVVASGVVGYKFVTEGLPFELGAFLGVVVQVVTYSAGGKMLIGSVAKKVGGTKPG
jgi:hypothetical protein